jgi:hypothetical protein
MAATQNLERFTLEETDDGYLLSVGSDDGQAIQVAVSPDQLDAIIDALNDVLGDEDNEVFDEQDDED